ncbi:hypothetical protein, partial [Salmonella sp. s54836]|uniref:hypothetical protein n=1 Tax=Salmonella sp. s54836 TaxID=3159673 RepID=UPI003980797E
DVTQQLYTLQESTNASSQESKLSIDQLQKELDFKLKEQEQIFDDKLAQVHQPELTLSPTTLNSTLTNNNETNPFKENMNNNDGLHSPV